MENLNAQTNLNNQLKSQYANLLRINNNIEKTNEDLREKTNSLLIQKDLIENDMFNLRNSLEHEKNSNVALITRLNELGASFEALANESAKIKDKENFHMNEILKLNAIINQLDKEKTNLEFQLKNIEQNINQNENFFNSHQPIEIEVKNGLNGGSHKQQQQPADDEMNSSSELVNEILKKFNEERKARQIAEENAADLEKTIKMLNSDLKYLKDDLFKKEKEFSEELYRHIGLKKELDADLSRRTQEIKELHNEIANMISNQKIKEKHFNKNSLDLKEENLHLKEECDKLRKVALDTENTKIKKLQEEIDELKTMNQLYRSQRLESDEEISNFAREKDKLQYENAHLKKEYENVVAKYEHQRQKAESEYNSRYLSEQRSLSLEQDLNMREQKFDETCRKYMLEVESLKEHIRNSNNTHEDLLLKGIYIYFFFYASIVYP